jgi:Mg-chelatase subunit ChlD
MIKGFKDLIEALKKRKEVTEDAARHIDDTQKQHDEIQQEAVSDAMDEEVKNEDSAPDNTSPPTNSCNDKVKVFNLIILDESGSMESIKRAAIGGLNETVQSIQSAQKKHEEVQEHYVTFVSFNTNAIRTVFENRPVTEVKLIKDYQPNAGTPLYDAMGISLTKLRHQLSDEEQHQVLVTIITDGCENASREYSGAAIKKLVEELKKQGWVFAYIGTNQDVDAVADSLSIDNRMDYDYSSSGTEYMLTQERRSRERFFNRVSARLDDPDMNLQEAYFDADSAFYLDNTVLENLQSLLPADEHIREQFKQDLEWFQNEHIKGRRSQYYRNMSRENHVVIERFEDYIRNKAYARHIDIHGIISKLKELYILNL